MRKPLALGQTNGADIGELQRILFGNILRSYSGPKTLFEGTVVLLRTSQKKLSAEGIAVKSDYGWGRYSNNDFTVHLVPGDHLSMLQNPHVDELAKLVRAYL
jgi:thioesterase domain-containing protein